MGGLEALATQLRDKSYKLLDNRKFSVRESYFPREFYNLYYLTSERGLIIFDYRFKALGLYSLDALNFI